MNEQTSPDILDINPYVSVDIDWIKEQEEKIGKTNRMQNPYSLVLKECQKYVDVGLTPAVFCNQITGYYAVTSEEYYNGKMN